MKTLRFDKNIIHTFTDIPNHSALQIIVRSGCNLNCYECHSKRSINTHRSDDLTFMGLVTTLKRNRFGDALILTGGEVLCLPLTKVKEMIKTLKKETGLKIALNTNGTYPEKLHELISVLDFVFLDVKHSFTTARKEDIEEVLGVEDLGLLDVRILESMDILSDYPEKSHLRTVKYPMLTESHLKDIRKHVESFGLAKNYRVNDFVSTD